MEIVLVIMPTYLGDDAWIERALKSVQAQTRSDLECWLVKDGCQCVAAIGNSSISQATECEPCIERMQYIRKFCKQDRRFKAFNLPANFGNAGWGPRNFALLNSDHEHIAYLDDDNWWHPEHLEGCYQAIQGVDFVFTGTNLYDASGKKVGERMPQSPAYGAIDTSEIMHRRELINKFGGWRNVAENDWDLVKRWMAAGIAWRHTGKITLNYMYRGVPAGHPR